MKSFIKKYKTAFIIVAAILFAISINAILWSVGVIVDSDTLIPAIMSLASMWAVRLTLAASLAPKYGLKGVWTAMAIELVFRGTMFLARLFKGGWAEKMKVRSVE